MSKYAQRLTRWPALAVLLTLTCAAWAAQPQLVVITGADAPQMSFDLSTVRNIYLKKIYIDRNGQRITPVNLPSGTSLREAFTSTFLHMDDAQLQNYWDRQYYQGVSPPYVLGSSDAVVRFVAKTPGAIGYVAPCFADSTVHVVMTVALPQRLSDDLPACPDRHTP